MQSEQTSIKLLTWNVNHRIQEKTIPPFMAEAIGSLEPDMVVLTEYVPGPSRADFLDGLDAIGLGNRKVSEFTPKQNHVLIASRFRLEEGSIKAPALEASMPSNALHVCLPDQGIEVLGIRVPDYSKLPAIRHACWDWIMDMASRAKQRPFVMLGDFNTDPRYPPSRCGDRIGMLVADGWQHAMPSEGGSYWTLKDRHECRIDHAFVSEHFKVLDAKYVARSNGFVFGGEGDSPMSDHAALVLDIDLTKSVAEHEQAL